MCLIVPPKDKELGLEEEGGGAGPSSQFIYLLYTTWYTLPGIHYLVYTTWYTLYTAA